MKVRFAPIAFAMLATAGCSTADGGIPNVLQGRLYVVGIDVSESRTKTQREQAAGLIGRLVDQLSYGDRLVLVQAYQQGTQAAPQWADSVPSLRHPPKETGGDKQRLQDFRAVASSVASSLFDVGAREKIPTTDLFYTLGRAADYMRAAGGRPTTIVLTSDMLQSTKELDMERPGGIPDQSWIEERKTNGRLPDLSGACVVIDGADVLSARGAKVRRFWEAYFRATGATLPADNYRDFIADPSELRCR